MNYLYEAKVCFSLMNFYTLKFQEIVMLFNFHILLVYFSYAIIISNLFIINYISIEVIDTFITTHPNFLLMNKLNSFMINKLFEIIIINHILISTHSTKILCFLYKSLILLIFQSIS